MTVPISATGISRKYGTAWSLMLVTHPRTVVSESLRTSAILLIAPAQNSPKVTLFFAFPRAPHHELLSGRFLLPAWRDTCPLPSLHRSSKRNRRHLSSDRASSQRTDNGKRMPLKIPIPLRGHKDVVPSIRQVLYVLRGDFGCHDESVGHEN